MLVVRTLHKTTSTLYRKKEKVQAPAWIIIIGHYLGTCGEDLFLACKLSLLHLS